MTIVSAHDPAFCIIWDAYMGTAIFRTTMAIPFATPLSMLESEAFAFLDQSLLETFATVKPGSCWFAA